MTKAAAQEALDKIRGQRRTASYVRPTTDTVAEYMSKWLASLPAQGRRPSTVDSYKRCLDYVLPDLGHRRLDALTVHDLDELYGRLLVSGKRQAPGTGLSPRTVRYVHTVVHKALSDAVRKGTLARNVAEVASPPSSKSTKPPEMAWWQPNELNAFLAMTAEEPLGPLFRLAGMTGMRRGEVCGLCWSDVDLDRGRIEVRHQLNVVRGAPNGGLIFSETTKTASARRTIDLDQATVSVLKAQSKRQKEHRLAIGAGWQNERDLVFTAPDGRPLDPESVAKVFARRVARSGLPRLRFHDLRHTHVAHLIAAEVPILVISKRLGHSSVSFTLDRYGHMMPEADFQAASAVAAMVDGA
jgi:integrase